MILHLSLPRRDRGREREERERRAREHRREREPRERGAQERERGNARASEREGGKSEKGGAREETQRERAGERAEESRARERKSEREQNGSERESRRERERKRRRGAESEERARNRGSAEIATRGLSRGSVMRLSIYLSLYIFSRYLSLSSLSLSSLSLSLLSLSLSLSLHGPKGGWPSCITFVKHISYRAGLWLVAMALCRRCSLWMMGSLHAAEKIASRQNDSSCRSTVKSAHRTLLTAASGKMKKTAHKEIWIITFLNVCIGCWTVEVRKLSIQHFTPARKLN